MAELLTLDELTERVSMSVRNIRFYTTKGLVPPPVRRGRSGYYSADHVARLQLVRELQEHGFTLEESTFYSDSFTDLPLLEAVAEPVVVNPDPRLERLAKKRGWRMELW